MTQWSVFVVTACLVALMATVGTLASAAEDQVVTGTGEINAIMAEDRKVNITHDPIPALGWPGMTMDFQLAESAELEGIEVGAKVTFQLRKGADGSFRIESLSAQ